MLALAVRGLAARKLRGVLTAFAILLGVAMVAGTFMLKGSIDKAFDGIFAEANAGVDVTVKPKQAFSGQQVTSGIALPQALVKKVGGVDGVQQAVGSIDDDSAITILGSDGKRIGNSVGAPQLTESDVPEPFNPFTWEEGGPPNSAGEVGIDSITADQEGYEVGQEIPIAGQGGVERYTLSGIGRFGTGVTLGGASIAVFTLQEAQRITGKDGQVDDVLVQAADGVAAEELSARINSTLPASVVAQTGAQDAAQQSTDIKDAFGFLTTILLVFAGISVFVGAFLIFNTFSITVAQRTREFGMLRTLGASSRQVLASVVIEALVLGLIASVIGIFAGLGFVKLITGLFKAIGFALPQAGTVVPTAAIVAPLLVGIISTLASSIVPALRATRVTPLEALRDTAQVDESTSRRRIWIARGLIAVSAVAIVAGLFATSSFASALVLLGVGVILLFVGIAMLAGAIVRPLASFVGRPVEALRGVTGRLARENTLRNPGRTATTSAALMIGVALVVFAAVFATSATKSVGDALDRTFAGDLVIANRDGFTPFSKEVGPQIAKLDGVATVSPVAGAPAQAVLPGGDKQQILTGLDPATLPEVAKLDWVDGSDQTLRDLGPSDAIVESKWADDNGVSVGDTLTLRKIDGSELQVNVVGSIRDQVSLLVQSIALPISTLRSQFDARQDFTALVAFAPGADFDATRSKVADLLSKRFPQVEARSQAEFKKQQEDQINQLLGLIYALLGLSVIVSLFGVVNTLVLTIYERTREIGMLRAIGASRSQIRRMIRYESLITAMIGAIIGVAVGLVIAVAAVEALKDQGLSLGIPIGGIVGVLIFAAIAGVLAGIWPARRASKIEVMEALQYE